MKKYDPNNFIIDHVFASIDKKYKKKKKHKKLDVKDYLDPVNPIEVNSKEEPINNEYYKIDIIL